MATEMEDVTILKVDTGEAVKNIADLKENIRLLKRELNGWVEDTGKVDEEGKKVLKTHEALAIGTTEYKETLEELKVNQNALKDAMYATDASMEDVAKSAKGVGETYNALVARMAEYKRELRATDISTKEGKDAFDALASKINEVNDKLKDMDAQQGNFQRNVGNYESHWKALAKDTDALKKGLDLTKGSLDGVKNGFEALNASPAIGTFAVIASVVMKLASSLKDNETAMASIKKLGESMKPMMDFFNGILEKIAGWLSQCVDWMVDLAGESGDTFSKIVGGVTGVGNAIIQFLIYPIKQSIEAFKGLGKIMKDIFTGDWKSIKGDAEELGKGISDAFTKGFSFKANFKEGQNIGENFVHGISSNAVKRKAREQGQSIGKEMADGVREGFTLSPEDVDRIFDEQWKNMDAQRKAKEQDDQLLAAETEAMWAETNSQIDAYFEEQLRIEQEAADKERAIVEGRKKAYTQLASNIGSIFDTIGQFYETDADKSEEAFQKNKMFQIAETWVSTLSGMIASVRSVWADTTIPTAGLKAALAATNAGAILANGVMTTNRIKSTTFNGGGVGSAPTLTAPATRVSAPSLQTSLPQMVQMVQGWDTTPSQVYILQSDIEASGLKVKVRDSESSW